MIKALRSATPLRRLGCAFAALLLAFAVAGEAAAHGRDAVPEEPELRAQYEAGLKAFYNDDDDAALAAWRPLAERATGSAAAQIFLGFMHETGISVAEDPAAAAEWYARAAEQDHALAQIRLAVLYRRGRGVAQDPARAFQWAALAARHDDHLKGAAAALRDAVAAGLTSAERADAEKLVAVWLAAHPDAKE